MKKTTGITLGVIMTALIAAGCGEEERRCVDANNVVVSDELCKDDDGSGGRTTHGTTGVFVGGHRWYYGGSGHTVGSVATGGGYVSRGGFGRSASSFSSSSS